MKRMIVISVALCVVVALSVAIAAAKANFAGTWKQDPTKSEGGGPGGGGGGGGAGGGGGGGQMGDVILTITQDGDKLTSVRKTGRGDQTTSYTLDGKESEFTMQRGGNEVKGKRTAKWSADGNTIEISSTTEGQNGPVTTTQKWSLSADGKWLTIESTSPRGTSKAVYAKQ